MKGITPTLLAIALYAIAPAPSSAQQRVYKWTDAQGVVHYSQTAPDKIQAEAKDLRSRDPKDAVAAPAPAEAAKPAESDACVAAKRNRDLLAGSGPVARDMDGDGKPDVMTDQQRASALAQSEVQVDRFCKASATPGAAPAGTGSESESAPEPEPEPEPASTSP